jgi:glycosyltransferase involved in cell wall biosynthesis
MPKTILYTSLSGNMLGGGQHSLRLLIERLDRSRYAPVVLCPGDGDFAASMRSMNVPVEIVPQPPLRRFRPSSVAKIAALLRRRSIALVHTDAPRGTFYAGVAARLAGTPVVWHVRTAERQHPLFERVLYSLSTRVIAVSGAAADRFAGFGGRGRKVSTIFNAVDTVSFNPSAADRALRTRLGASGKLLALTAGQLLPRKGHETFFKAAAVLNRVAPGRWLFVVAGRGEKDYEERLRRLAREQGIDGQVVFGGFREDIAAVMASADIFVLATEYREGLSRVLLEAMASAVPVITTPLGGNVELVEQGKTGFLVNPSDPSALAAALSRLADDPALRRQMGAAGRRFVEERCGTAAHVAAIEEVYGAIL